MKIAAFSDIHFHPFPAFAKIGPDGINSRLTHTFNRARDIVRIAQEQGCKLILFGGDLFHTKKIDNETIDLAERAFADCSIPIIGVPGNHDMATFGPGARHAARALSKKIQWLDSPDGVGRTVLYKTPDGDRISIHGIPYIHDRATLNVELSFVPEHIDILLMHCGFAGGIMGSDYIADLGDCIDYMAVKGKAKLVVSGHFHQPQLIKFNANGDWENNRPTGHDQYSTYEDGHAILVPGSPEQHTWGDKDSARGFWIVDTDKRTATFHRLNSPEFVEIQSGQLRAGASIKHDQYVRVVGNPDAECLEELRMATQTFVVETPPTFAARPTRAFDIAVGDAPTELVRKYVETADTTLDRARLIQEGQRLLCN